MKTVKGKLAQKLFATLSLLMAFCILATWCGKSKAVFRRGFGYNFEAGPLMLAVSSESDTFDANNVTLDLHFAFYNSKKRTPEEAKRMYYQAKEDDNVFFSLYIRGEDDFLDEITVKDGDYTNIENYHFVKTIYDEEAFSGEYGYTMGYIKGIIFDHNEPITIPAQFFNKMQGSFQILIMSFYDQANENGDCNSNGGQALEIDYQMLDDGTIKLK